MLREEDVDLPGGRFHVLRAGRPGAPLAIVLHGFPDHPPSFAPVIDAIADGGHDVVAPWLRGYAPSPLAGPFHLERIAQDVLELARALGHDRFDLIGHDWGALATYVLCATAPERVRAAVTMSIPHPHGFRRPAQALRSAYIPVLALPGGATLARAADFTAIDLLWRIWSPGFRLDDAARAALHACLATSWPAPARYYRAVLWPLADATRRFGPRFRIETPLLALHGADDGCVAAATARGQARHFRGPFEAELIDGAGHFLANEVPHVIADRALTWLRDDQW